MSSQWENQQWDVIRVIFGLFPIILGEKVFFSPYEKWWFSLVNLFPFQFGGFFVRGRNLWLKVDALCLNASLLEKHFSIEIEFQ